VKLDDSKLMDGAEEGAMWLARLRLCGSPSGGPSTGRRFPCRTPAGRVPRSACISMEIGRHCL